MGLNTLWIARDMDGCLNVYYDKPTLEEDEGYKFWHGRYAIGLRKDSYPEVTFENSPQRLISSSYFWNLRTTYANSFLSQGLL